MSGMLEQIDVFSFALNSPNVAVCFVETGSLYHKRGAEFFNALSPNDFRRDFGSTSSTGPKRPGTNFLFK